MTIEEYSGKVAILEVEYSQNTTGNQTITPVISDKTIENALGVQYR